MIRPLLRHRQRHQLHAHAQGTIRMIRFPLAVVFHHEDKDHKAFPIQVGTRLPLAIVTWIL